MARRLLSMLVVPPLSLCLLAGCSSAPAVLPAPATTKPVSTEGMVAAAKPKLAEYVARVLPGTSLGDREVSTARLVEATLFTEGYVNETWRLEVEVDGAVVPMVLKLFATPEESAASGAQLRTARDKGWPVPAEYVRGPITPYSDRHGVLREFVPDRSAAAHVRDLCAKGPPDPLEVAAAYAKIAETLGRLHERNRKEQTEGRSDGPRLKAVAARCSREGWCSDQARRRLEELADRLDRGPVSFIHGDLYEEQVILGADGQLMAFVDVDHAGFSDPAADVGALLAHILVVNPISREARWKVAGPTPDETRRTATCFLASYRETAWLPGTAWAEFLERAQAYLYLRLGLLLERYRDNPHAQAVWTALDSHRKELFEGDVFAEFGLTPK